MSIGTRTNLGFVSVTAANTATVILGHRRRYKARPQHRGGPARRENRQLAALWALQNPANPGATAKSYEVSVKQMAFPFLAIRTAPHNPLSGFGVLRPPRAGYVAAPHLGLRDRGYPTGADRVGSLEASRETTLTRSVPAPTNHRTGGLHGARRCGWGRRCSGARLRCKFGYGTRGISHADHRRVGPR